MLRPRIRLTFVALLALAGASATPAQYDLSWWTVDGNVDFADIDPFVALLTGGEP